MNEHVDFERTVAGHIASEGVPTPSEAFYAELFTRTAAKGPRPEWLAFLREKPMRTESRLAVGSPTFRAAAVLAATLLLALVLAAAGVAGQRLLAANDAIVVAQDGSGDVTTISEAVGEAADGQRILIRPGHYVESVEIASKDLHIEGEGDAAEIILDHDVAAPTIPGVQGYGPMQYGILLDDTSTTISNLTLMAPGVAIAVEGGAPTISDVIIDDPVETDEFGELLPGVPEPELWIGYGVLVGGDSRALIEAVTTDAAIYFGGGSSPTLRKSDIDNYVYLDGSTSPTIVDNHISHLNAWAVPVTGIFADNDLDGSRWPGEEAAAIDLNLLASSDIVLRGNTVNGADYPVGISVRGGPALLEDNMVRGVGTGILLGTGLNDDIVLRSNTVTGNSVVGVEVQSGSPTLESNMIDLNPVGLRTGSSTPQLVDNHICDNATNLEYSGGSAPPSASQNEICADAPAG